MKILNIFLILLSLLKFQSIKESNYYANSFIVMEQRTNTIIEGVNYYKTQSVASISKIMTGILAIEYLDLDQKVYVDDCIDKAYGSAVYLKKGTWISNEDLIYGLMLRSGNDCALMIAKSVCNSYDKFIDLMNEKAKEIGMNYTTFVNPHGLDEEDGGNYSCAYDMALLQTYALQNETYRLITSSKTYKSENYGIWVNKNKLLNQYFFAISGKTGYTKKAKRTLVTSAKKDNLELTIVTLNCGGDFAYHKQLYEKHFDIYGSKLIVEKGELRILDYLTYIDEDIYYFAKKEDLEKLKVLIEINKSNNEGKIYILIDNNKEMIESFNCVKDERKNTLWDLFYKTWKEMIV